MTTYPYGYGTQLKTLEEIRAILLVHYHPEFVRRFCAWLASRGGTIGVGGHWRAGGAQPDKPGFAPEGKSFHQDQPFNDGFTGACAIDLVVVSDASLLKRMFSLNGSPSNPDASTLKRLFTTTKVHRAPYWSEVPAQGSIDAKPYGVHCNITSETWHMQWTDIWIGGYDLDGWQSWWNAGRPAPVAGYPIPGALPPAPPEIIDPPPPPEELDMTTAIRWRHIDYSDQFVLDGARVKRPTRAQFDAMKLRDLELVTEDDDAELVRICEQASFPFVQLTPA